jgi:CRISPR-associated protein (TIGR03984 family)
MKYNEAMLKLMEAFPGKVWVYAVEDHQVQIGVWDGSKLSFKEDITPEYLLELRVFKARELRLVPDGAGEFLLRDSADYDNEKVIDDRYIMYGEKPDYPDSDPDSTYLSEARGGIIRFPKHVDFPKDKVEMKLGVRQFWRYNKVPVLPKGEPDASVGLNPYGQGTLEIYDFAFTGFYDATGKEVEL